MTTTTRIITSLLFCISVTSIGQNTVIKTKINSTKEWIIADLLRQKLNVTEITGQPQLVNSPYGEAVSFNGKDDAFFINELPLQSLKEFTVEMIFKPESNGLFEQRILHIGESTKDRMLLEIRSVGNDWYFDGYAASGTNKKALIDEKLIHPSEKWYHVAFVVTAKSLTTYVNGKQELFENFSFLPIESGQTSIGVRMNKVCWFKGAIYKIRITPKPIQPKDFIKFKE